MVCIYCGNQTQVSNSRLQRTLNQVWRRRRCGQCNSVFTTLEAPNLEGGFSVQYSPTDIRPFQCDALFVSIYESVKHRTNALEDATALTQTVTSLVLKKARSGLILRETVIDAAHQTLIRFDAAAATVYAAYHRK